MKKTKIMSDIEARLDWSQDEIFEAVDILHDSACAELNQDTDQNCILWDSSIQEMCFEYLDEYSSITEHKKDL